ncbi:MAG: hydrogenase expression/formation protein [Deltaproteobacteria bacterium]|nr:hydrogenase expression/formation protein [Deltaproteobacteria bacterium]
MHFSYHNPKRHFPVGKLPLNFLDELLRRYAPRDDHVIVGPGIGADAAVIETGGPRYLIAKTDPITFTAEHMGWYAVHINANDIAAMGGRPRWFLATLLLPENKTTSADVEKIFAEISTSCASLGITLVGGHTEITYDLNRPLIVGQMLGEVEKDKLVRSGGSRPGDAIVLTKGIAVEGTAIIAGEWEAEVTRAFGTGMVGRCKNFIYEPGISVVKEALLATERFRVHAMHDPTEGGVATALHELGRAADVGILAHGEAIKIFPETQRLCDHFQIDPLGLIASGALLVTLEPAEAEVLISTLAREGIAAARIGEVVPKSQGVKVETSAGLKDLRLYEQDELTKIAAAVDRS